MYIYVCICMCVYIYVCICMCVYMYVCIYSMLKTKVTDKLRVGWVCHYNKNKDK